MTFCVKIYKSVIWINNAKKYFFKFKICSLEIIIYIFLYAHNIFLLSILLEIHTRKYAENISEERSDEDNDDDADAEQTTSMRVTHIEITTEGRSEIKPKCQHVDDGKIVDLS